MLGVDAKHITILYKSGEKVLHELNIFTRSNDDGIIEQKPLMSSGQKFKKGEVLVDAQATQNGELAIGRNLTVAYMPWKGYNFEDAIIISSAVVEDDFYTSVHIKSYSLDVRETKL